MRLIALLLSIALTSATDNKPAMDLLRQWVLAVDAHMAGENDGPLDDVIRWTHDDLAMMRTYVETLSEAPTERNRDRARRRDFISNGDLAAIREMAKNLKLRGDFDTFRKRAVILHTDAALLGDAPTEVGTPTARRRPPRWARPQVERQVIVKSFDGRVESYVLGNLHWDFAMDLLDALPATPKRDPLVAQWYRAIGAFMVSQRQFAEAVQHFSRAKGLNLEDANVLFGEACLQETLGAPRVQDYVRVTTLPNGLFFTDISSASTHWRRAEALLRRALTIDPALAEARLRLGRVLIVQDRHEEGLQALQRAISESTDRLLTFYANLFSGDAELSLGKADDARISYERAIALFPNSQAAQIGLASALRTDGDADALAAMLPTLTRDEARDGDDPWWDYYFGDAVNVESLLEQLRAPYLSPRQ